jgi:hypothetical protein
MDQPPTQPGIHNFTFSNIWALDQPPLAGSSLMGDVSGITFQNVKYGQTEADSDAGLALIVSEGAKPATFLRGQGPMAHFTASPPVSRPDQKITFTAEPSPHATYTWLFGDGTQAKGRSVSHKFPDAEGTQLDGAATGAGRFRVLLRVEDQSGKEDWAAQSMVVVGKWHDAAEQPATPVSGLQWRLYPGEWTELPDLSTQQVVFTGESPNLHADSHGFTRYAVSWDGLIDIPADGGYTFHLLHRDGARLVIDGIQVAKTGPPFAQVCGSPGNAMRYDRGSLGLRAGKHILHIEGLHSVSQGPPQLLWEGPAIPLTTVPPAAFSHLHQDVISK